MIRSKLSQSLTFGALTLSALLLSGCALGPDYQRPSVKMPVAFKESAGWKVGEPQQVNADPNWWSHFNDPVLDQLERDVTVSSQTIAQSEAAYRGAVAAADAANATLFPVVGVNGSFDRAKSSSARTGTSVIANSIQVGASASWNIDLWGRLRRQIEAAEATSEASQAQLAGVRLSVQAALASDYFALRGADELSRLLQASVAAYEKSLQITQNQYKAGTANKADVDQATTQLESTRSQSIAVEVTRAQLEHAIAVLLGKAPADFSLPPQADLPNPPDLLISVPSSLLERRPDVAAAEKQMTAANAQIGVAIAAYFPDLTLSGSVGQSSNMFSNLFKASNNIWSFGPSLAETVIDWGARDAQLAQAHASYDQEVASYRQTVLIALQQVEDDLVSASHLAQQRIVEDRAVASAVEAERLITNQYRAGTVAYTSVVTAQTAALSAKQAALTIHQNQLTTSVALLQALGGGWQGLTATATASAP